MPPEPSPTPSHVSLRTGMHDLRNVLNAVQINAFAARHFVDDAPRALACLSRIEDAVARGAGVLQGFPAEETLSSAAVVLRDRLRDAGGDADVACAGDADGHAWVPGLVRQSLCLVAVESHARGARRFVLSIPGTGEDNGCLECAMHGLRSPGPVAMALGASGLPGLAVRMTADADGWTFRWSLHELAFQPTVVARHPA